MPPVYTVEDLKHEISQMEPGFSLFHEFRDEQGTWNKLREGQLPSELPPEMEPYAEGLRHMSAMLEDDVRILKGIKVMNPTRNDAQVRGVTQKTRDLESDWKLYTSSCWENQLNPGRILDDYVGEAQLCHGVATLRIVPKPHAGMDEGDCPIGVEKVLLDGVGWLGEITNPDAFWYRYSVPVMDARLKRKDGSEPTLDAQGKVAWKGQHESHESTYTTGKRLQVIVRDALDPIAICPMPGCYHRRRWLCVWVAPEGSGPDDYEEVEVTASPMEKCSFLIIPGDWRQTATDPHWMLRPEILVLYQLVYEYNHLFTELLVAHRREQADERKGINAAGSSTDVINATVIAEGGNPGTVHIPEPGSGELPILPGPVIGFGQPSTELLKYALAETVRKYEARRPNPALTGQMQLSEVAATGIERQVEGAGVAFGPPMAHWDDGIGRIFNEIRHVIRYYGYVQGEDSDLKYTAQVTGYENVRGYRKHGAGEEIYIDPRKAELPVTFRITTSKDTPAEKNQRRMMAITGRHEGILTSEMVMDAWDVNDIPMNTRALAREQVMEQWLPMRQQLIWAVAEAMASGETGMDLSPIFNAARASLQPQGDASQTRNTEGANFARTQNPGVQLNAVGSPEGGNSSLAGAT